MRHYLLILFLFVATCSCNNENGENAIVDAAGEETETAFDKQKWNTKEGGSYPYRAEMLNNVIFNDSLRALKRKDVIAYLGEPTRVNNEYIYYLIETNKVLLFTLKAKTLVIKFNEDNRVDWMKIHG